MTTNKTSFGEYFDAQRDRMIKDMQNKNAQQCIEWMEDYEKRQEAKKQELLLLKKMAPVGRKEKKLLEEMMQEERLFWWETIGT